MCCFQKNTLAEDAPETECIVDYDFKAHKLGEFFPDTFPDRLSEENEDEKAAPAVPDIVESEEESSMVNCLV